MGCFTSRGVGYLYKIDGGLDAKLYRKILDENFMETLQYYEFDALNIIFQQNNDLKHTAILIKQWFDDNSIEVLPWPPQLPDLNPIEHFWNDVDHRLKALNIEIREKDALWKHVF
ncbi:pre-rRNA-processing protein TSR1 homolog [Rhizophagus clarus]|nr:pre-rRNA-processing protein TSR1 homolog [Rhizophagus clarus]